MKTQDSGQFAVYFAADWVYVSVTILVSYVLSVCLVIWQHWGIHMMDPSAFFLIALYLIRFIFITVFQVHAYRGL